MGAIEITLLAFGAFVMAANQALKDADALTVRFKWLKPKSWWNYVLLACVTAAALVFGVQHIIHWEGPRELSGKAPVAIEARASKSVKSGAKLSGVNLERLRGFVEGRSAYEADLLSKPFVGAPVTVSGPIANFYEDVTGEGRAALGDPNSGDDLILMSFEKAAFVPVTRLQKGDEVSAHCLFVRVSGNIIEVETCRLDDQP